MIRLTSAYTLRIKLNGAAGASEPSVVVHYSDQTSSSYAGGTVLSNTTGSTQKVICTAPSGSTVRDIDYITVWNQDTQANTVTIWVDDGSGSIFAVTKATLAINECLTYTHSNGWQTTDTAGGLKTNSAVSIINGVTLANLATGLLKNTTGTGAPSIAVAGTDYAAPTSGSFLLAGNGAGGHTNVTTITGGTYSAGTLTINVPSPSLSALTAATTTNSIANSSYAQQWGWTFANDNTTGLFLTETAGTANTGCYVFSVDTAAASSGNPFKVAAGGTSALAISSSRAFTVAPTGYTITNTGNYTYSTSGGGNSTYSITSGTTASSAITIKTGDAGASSSSGVTISTGNATGGSTTPGTLTLSAGNAVTTAARPGGAIAITAGNGTTSGTGGAITITSGTSGTTGTGGNVNIITGAGGATSGSSGIVNINTGTSTAATGAISIKPGQPTGVAIGGSGVTISGGDGSASGGGGSNAGGGVTIVAGNTGSSSTASSGKIQVGNSVAIPSTTTVALNSGVGSTSIISADTGAGNSGNISIKTGSVNTTAITGTTSLNTGDILAGNTGCTTGFLILSTGSDNSAGTGGNTVGTIQIDNGATNGNPGTVAGVIEIGKVNASKTTIGHSGSPGLIFGVTDASAAAAGVVGELISSTIASGSAVALVTATAKNVTSITLTAGDWDIWGWIGYITAATTSVTVLNSSISITTNTTGTHPVINRTAAIVPTAFTPAFGQAVHYQTQNVSGSTIYYLVANATFTVAALTAYGYIYARRRH